MAAGARSCPSSQATQGRARLGRLPLPWKELVESNIDKAADEVHEGVDGVGGAEVEDARGDEFPAECAQRGEKKGCRQAADNFPA